MELKRCIEEKRKYSGIIRENFEFMKKIKPIWMVLVSDEINLETLAKWLSVLPCNFIIKGENPGVDFKNIKFIPEITEINKLGLDFVLTNFEEDLSGYFNFWVVPIVSSEKIWSEHLEEFNPVSTSGNSFMFEHNTEWDMFYALVKYLENYKFPYDNKNLIKNVIESAEDFC